MTKRQAQHYADQSVHYVLNADKAFSEGETAKAGEFLWGGMAQALKAHAARNGYLLKRHDQIIKYARDLSKTLNDPELYGAFRKVQGLHSNFYEVDVDAAEVEDIMRETRPYIGIVLSAAGFPPTI